MVVECLSTARNLVVAVQVAVHDITGSPVATQRALIGCSQVSVHLLVALSDTDGLEAPDLVHVTTLDVVVDRTGGVVRITGNLGAGIRDVECYTVRKTVLEHVAPANLQLPTSSTQVGIVSYRHACTKDGGQLRSVTNHILSVTDIVIESTSQAVVESAEVETEVVALNLLPCKQSRNQSRSAGGVRLSTILQPCTGYRVVSDSLVSLIPVVDVLVTQRTVRSTQLQGVDSTGQVLPELLAGNVPTQ